MSDRDLLRAEALRWLRYAQEDIHTADTLLEAVDVPLRTVCFHSQQATEKALKAVLVYEDIDVPRTHDLSLLQSLLPEAWAVKRARGDLTALSIWATHPRYPGDWPEATHEDAADAMALARQVLVAVLQDFKALGLELQS